MSGAIVLDTLGRAYITTPAQVAAIPRSAIARLAASGRVVQSGMAAFGYDRASFAGAPTDSASNAADQSHAFVGTGPVGPYASAALRETGIRLTPSFGRLSLTVASNSFAAGLVATPVTPASPSGLVDTLATLDQTRSRHAYAVAVAGNGVTFIASTSANGTMIGADQVFGRGDLTTTLGLRFADRHSPRDTLLEATTIAALGIDGDRSAGLFASVALTVQARVSIAVSAEADMVRVSATGSGLATGNSN